MLSFDIRSLDAGAAQVDGDLPASDPVWQEEDVRPSDAVHVTGRLSTAGKGRWYFSGALEGSIVEPCRRCLTDVEVPVASDVHLLFAEEGDETAEEDPDVYPVPARENAIDLRPAV